jgi:2-hydroxy-4-carboxymuconate semialdehyde hemiacetal dehydrogenase
MNRVERQDREVFAAIREGRDPDRSVAQVLSAYQALDHIQNSLL